MLHSSPDQSSDDPIFDMLGASLHDSDISEYQDAAAALAYSASVAPLNPKLKNRLFETLGLELPDLDILSLLTLSIEELKRTANSLSWEGMEEAPGFDMAIWKEQDHDRMMACFIRAEQPASFPNHYHPAEEVIVVLGGDLVEAANVYAMGDRLISPANSSHQLDTTQGCLLFCIASMDNQFGSRSL